MIDHLHPAGLITGISSAKRLDSIPASVRNGMSFNCICCNQISLPGTTTFCTNEQGYVHSGGQGELKNDEFGLTGLPDRRQSSNRIFVIRVFEELTL